MKKPLTEQRKYALEYLLLYRKLMRLNREASMVISRRDNNAQFEMAWKCREIAQRIKNGYPDTNY